MKLSLLVAVTDKDRGYNDLLLKSIKENISLDESEYEVIVEDNSKLPPSVTGVGSHAAGLTEGYKKTKGEIVLTLDPDTAFLKNEWAEELLGHFNDPDVAFAAGILCEAYSYPFYRSHFLAIRSSFYKDLIINKKGFFPVFRPNGKKLNKWGNLVEIDNEKLYGNHLLKGSGGLKLETDVAGPITKHCIDSNKKYIHYKNSLNDDVPPIYQGPEASGETVYNSKGDPFFHHVGRGYRKPKRFEKWKKFVEGYKFVERLKQARA